MSVATYLLRAIGYSNVVSNPTLIFCNNNATINLSEDLTLHSCVKHVDIKYYFLKERVQSCDLCIWYISTKNNVANIFTKALAALLFT